MISSLAYADDEFFPNLRQLLIIGCTSPVSSCEAERSFSALRRIKTYLRSTMGEERLSALTMMSVHFSEAKKIKTELIVKKFIEAHPRKLFCKSILFD